MTSGDGAPHRPRSGLALRDPFPWSVFSRLTRAAEELGYEALFLPEIAGRDAFAALAALARETRGLALATGVVPMTSRPLILTAMGAATVQDASGGRHVLGIGTGPARRGAVDRLRDRVEALRRLFAGEAADVDGRSVRLSLAADPPPPIWVAALGPRAVALAGEVADGVILNWCTPERVAEARASVRRAAERAGRDPDRVTVSVYVRGSVGAEPGSAAAALGAAAAEYARYPAYARQFEAMGLGREARAAAAGDGGDLAAAVCLPVHPAAARDRLDAYRGAGADLPVVYPVASGGDAAAWVEGTLRRLAPRPAAPLHGAPQRVDFRRSSTEPEGGT